MPPTASLSATFNDFLFATVCEEPNDMPLSVISALARLDLDPWAEAAELARMPADGAARRLSSLLAGVASVPATPPDRATIAVRLVALLPAAAKAEGSHTAAGVPTGAPVSAPGIMCLFFLAWMIASLLMGNLAPGAGAFGPAAGPVPSPTANARSLRN
jgi:hypothetical protein